MVIKGLIDKICPKLSLKCKLACLFGLYHHVASTKALIKAHHLFNILLMPLGN